MIAGVVVGIAVLVAAAVVLFKVFSRGDRPAALPVVEVQPVETSEVNIYNEYVGRIRAQQFVEIRARVEGYLEKMFFEEGTRVKKGQTLFVIDRKVYQRAPRRPARNSSRLARSSTRPSATLRAYARYMSRTPPHSSTSITLRPPTKAPKPRNRWRRPTLPRPSLP